MMLNSGSACGLHQARMVGALMLPLQDVEASSIDEAATLRVSETWAKLTLEKPGLGAHPQPAWSMHGKGSADRSIGLRRRKSQPNFVG